MSETFMTKEWCMAMAHRETEAEIAALQWTVTRLRSGLENWGRHHPWCAQKSEQPCDCGLVALLDNTAPAPDAPAARELDEIARLREALEQIRDEYVDWDDSMASFKKMHDVAVRALAGRDAHRE